MKPQFFLPLLQQRMHAQADAQSTNHRLMHWWLPLFALLASIFALAVIARQEQEEGFSSYVFIVIGISLTAILLWTRAEMMWHQRLKATQEVAMMKEFLHSIIDNIADPVFVKDSQHRWVFANQHFYDMLGLSEQDAHMKTDHDYLPKAQADFIHAKDREVLEKGSVTEVIEDFLDGGGQSRMIVTRKARFSGLDGAPYLVGIIRDMTDIHNAQEKLGLSNERLRLAKDAARFGLWEWDVEQDRFEWDDLMFSIFGIDPKVFTHNLQGFWHVVHPDDRDVLAFQMTGLLNNPACEVYEMDIRLKGRDGGDRFVQSFGLIKRNTKGKALRVVGLSRDVTLAKRMERQLREHKENLEELIAAQTQDLITAKERAEQANRAKSDFLSNMTHELRTPLNSIIGMTSLLQERSMGSEEKNMLGVVYQASNILYELVNNILDISKIEAGEVALENIGFDLTSVIGRVTNTLRAMAEKKGLDLRIHLPVGDIPFLLGDPLRISQVLTNLISNAIKYTEHGSVELKLIVSAPSHVRDACMLSFEVMDSGVGIPADQLENIFNKFAQVDISTTRRYGGSGLGLAICRELVERMGGEIGVTSKQGEGSCFWFSLALATTEKLHMDERGNGRKRDAARYAMLAPQDARLLVVEDHALNQILIRMLLEKYGFTNFTLVKSGREAVAYVQAHWENLDMILMDCFMPEMDGYEATRLIRQQETTSYGFSRQGFERRVPIVAITANAMHGDEEKCRFYGMDDYIAKPIQEKEFIQVLGQWVNFDAA